MPGISLCFSIERRAGGLRGRDRQSVPRDAAGGEGRGDAEFWEQR